MMKRTRGLNLILIASITAAMLAACTKTPGITPATKTEPPATQSTPFTATPTEVKQNTLTICIGQEPSTLYLYKGNSHSMWSILESVYDGPIDIQNYQPVPVILNEIPSVENSGLLIQSVPVAAGDIVVDVTGNLTALAAGVKVFPSGCSSPNCALTWDGVTFFYMDRMVANFVIKDGIKWSDGEPLTAEDSVYSFDIANDPATNVNKKMLDQTDSYQALDTHTVQWISKPGLVTRDIEYYFWIPLPKHIWKTISAADLQNAPESNERPLGWGPYMIDEWKQGDHIRLVKNPNYFRAAEGLPYFDTLVYRFVGSNADSNLQALASGECDIVDQSVAWEQQYSSVRDAENSGKFLVYRGLGPEWEHLDFDIKPAGYDDGYNLGVDRPDYFGDVRTRQAIAYCIDRKALVRDLFKNLSAVPLSYLPPDNPFYSADLPGYDYSIELGTRLLDEVGWKDFDNNPATPRTASSVVNVLDGTTFSITLTTSQADLRRQAAGQIAADLAKCGIQVQVNSVTRSELYATAPDGVVFGRKYDLAEFAWSAGKEPPCFIYETGEIASAANDWHGSFFGGLNNMGYSNPALDAACQATRTAGLDTAALAASEQQAQKILAEQLPSIPLFYLVRLAVSRLDLCGVKMDVSSRSEFSGLETIQIGSTCK